MAPSSSFSPCRCWAYDVAMNFIGGEWDGSCCWTMEQKNLYCPVYPLFRDDFFSLPICWFNHQLENSELQILPKPLLNGSKNCWAMNEFPMCNWVGSTTQPDFSRFLGFSLAAKLDPRLDRVNGQDVNSIETWKARSPRRVVGSNLGTWR